MAEEPIVIEIKCWPAPFSALLDHRKTFEFRRDDRAYKIGSMLHEREWEPCHRCNQTGISDHFHNPALGIKQQTCSDCRGEGGTYTGRDAWFKVTYTLRDDFGVPDHYVVMSVRPMERPSPRIRKRTR